MRQYNAKILIREASEGHGNTCCGIYIQLYLGSKKKLMRTRPFPVHTLCEIFSFIGAIVCESLLFSLFKMLSKVNKVTPTM